jgi:hypothetical protein
LTSLNSRLSEQRDAGEAIDSRARRRSLSSTQWRRLREVLLSDSYLFTKKICKHNEMIPELHMPMSYAACGLTDRLIEVLDARGFDSYVQRRFRDGLWARQIDWRTPNGWRELDAALDFLNFRWFRGIFKSSTITHGAALFMATVDPNSTIKITCATDDKAWAFCEQIGATVLSGTYRDFFPERIPEGNLSKLITMKEITLGGRTISHPQTTIQAGGYITKDEGAHYDTFFTDDLVNEGNSSPVELKGVLRWMRGLTGFYMPTRRIRRREVGTKHEEDDDDGFLTSRAMAQECLTIRLPIEEHDGPIPNVLVRGTPTIPQMYPPERIAKLQRHVLSDENEPDGVRSWLNNYLLLSRSASGRLFPPALVDDPDRWWLGPFAHTKASQHKLGRFLVARFCRDDEGRPVAKKDRQVVDADGNLLDGWRANAKTIVYCPWLDLDRVALVDPAWASREEETRTSYHDPDNWAVSAIGTDPEMVAFQLETKSDSTGTEGWIDALAEMDDYYHFRVIGFDASAWQDAVVANLMVTDKRLRRLRSRMRPIRHAGSKRAHLRAGLAEPLAMYQMLLRPDKLGNATRNELKNIRGVKNDIDGIADSLAMHRAVNKRSRSEKERQEDEMESALPRPKIDPILGVPVAA